LRPNAAEAFPLLLPLLLHNAPASATAEILRYTDNPEDDSSTVEIVIRYGKAEA
jgi:hypothetical protein